MADINLSEDMLNEMTPEEFDNFMDNDIYPERLNHLLNKQESSEEVKEEQEETIEEVEDTEDDVQEEQEEQEEASVEDSDKEQEEPEEKEQVKEESTTENVINYEEVYKQVFQPLKANKKEFIPQSPEEVRKLMQQGIDYTRKTQALAAKRKLVDTLEVNNISEEDLNFLIDVHKKNPEAIKQILRNNNIDPMDIDLEEGNYTPSNNIASEAYVETAEILDYVKASPHYNEVQEVLTNTWDKRSIDLIKQRPQLLLELNGEFEMGRFSKVQDYIEREKLLGIYGKSDIERYIELVSDGGKFAPTATTSTQNSTPSNTPVNRLPQGNKEGAKMSKNVSSPVSKKPKQVSNEQLDKMSEADFNKWFDNYLQQKE